MLAGKRIVCINIDETPLVRQMTNRRGYVVETAGHMEQDWHARITTRESRSHATLLAAVTDCPDLQKYLPPFVLTKDSALTIADKEKLRHMVRPVQWFEETDGWVTSDNLKPLFTALRRSIRERAPDAEIVLILSLIHI